MPRRIRSRPVAVGVSDHAGWAVLMTVDGEGALLDRRRVELVDAGLPVMPHHHDGQKLPLKEAVALVERVRASAERNAKARLAALAAELAIEPAGIALRLCPPLPETVAECITNYRAMCVADWVMYRRALAAAAAERGWSVHGYDAKRVIAEAASALERPNLDAQLAAAKTAFGSPWQVDHRVALAAAIVAVHART